MLIGRRPINAAVRRLSTSPVKTTLPDYPRITLAELSQFKLDTQSARRFERRFYAGFSAAPR